MIVKLVKKGDLFDCNDRRGNTFDSHIKLYYSFIHTFFYFSNNYFNKLDMPTGS